MSQVSLPVRIALLVAIAFAGVWFVALRPKADSSSSSSPSAQSAPGETGLKRAVDKAHGVVNDSNRAQGVPHPIAPSPSHPGTTVRPGVVPSTRSDSAKTGAQAIRAKTPGARRIARALAEHRTAAVLFYNPSSSDGRAVRDTLRSVDRHMGRVVIQSAPVSQLSDYSVLTTKAAIFGSPALAIVDGGGSMTVLNGFVDRLEIEQALWDALGLSGSKLGHLLHTRPLSDREFHKRGSRWCKRTAQSFEDARLSPGAGLGEEELAPTMTNIRGIAENDVAAFASLTPPRGLRAAQRAVVDADHAFLRVFRRLERSVARSSRPGVTFLAHWPEVRAKITALDSQVQVSTSRLGLRCS
jgi:hypothetical protein